MRQTDSIKYIDVLSCIHHVKEATRLEVRQTTHRLRISSMKTARQRYAVWWRWRHKSRDRQVRWPAAGDWDRKLKFLQHQARWAAFCVAEYNYLLSCYSSSSSCWDKTTPTSASFASSSSSFTLCLPPVHSLTNSPQRAQISANHAVQRLPRAARPSDDLPLVMGSIVDIQVPYS